MFQDAQDIVDKKTVLSESLHGRQVRCNWASRKNGTRELYFSKVFILLYSITVTFRDCYELKINVIDYNC